MEGTNKQVDIDLPGRGEKWSLVKLVCTAAAAAYFFWGAWHAGSWQFLDNVTLIFHEAGHIIFLPFGTFLNIAGGTILQIMIPAVIILYFARNGKMYSASFILFWLGESFLNASVYAADAPYMRLELLGGDTSGHDWRGMLDYLDIPVSTGTDIGAVLRIFGLAITVLAAILCFYYSRRRFSDA
jgi:hypothetical protein